MPATADIRAIIVGAGIGGLSAAIALRRAGIEAVVFERAADQRAIQVGGGFTQWPNAMRALAELGLAGPVGAAGAPFERAEFRTERGTVLAIWPVGDLARKHGGTAAFIERGALHRVLVSALDDEALHVGAECTGFTQDRAGVTVRFADGREERGDLLIGAGGLTSAIRAQLLGPAAPNYAGYLSWLAITPFAHEAAPPGVFRVHYGRGARFVFHPVGDGRLYWQAILNAPAGAPEPPEGKKAALLARYRGWAAPVEELIAATPEGAIRRMETYGRPPVKRWGVGRVTLLGDEAHPITFNIGQGAAQATEDAVVLAKYLAAGDDVPAALRAYEARRMGRTAAIQRQAWGLGTLGQLENPLACRLRNGFVRVGFNTVGLRAQERDMTFELLPPDGRVARARARR
jgi:2-polyprenyl-6-methoxyphenol hydroxylase-like FAD-dependent oxidoreductase